MKTSRSLAAVLTAIALTAPALVSAQEPVKSFDQLNTRLKPGDTIWVTDAQGREVKGKVQALAPEVITLKGEGPKTFAAGDVRLIQERRPDSLKNGALIGLGVGGGLVLGLCLAGEASEGDGWCALAAAIYGGAGAAIGVGIDALIPGKKIVAYRAPGPAGAPPARVSLAPVITPRAKGAAVSITF
jgi:hypothetical protein